MPTELPPSPPYPATSASGAWAYERILGFGDTGTGKTSAFLQIAEFHQRHGSDAIFYVLDTDNTMEAMVTRGRYAELTNLNITQLTCWDDYVPSIERLRKKVRPHDWCSIDLVSKAWSEVQDQYVVEIWGDLEDYWVNARKQGDLADGTPMDGWTDWQVINRMYRQFSNAVHRMQCHVYATAEQKELMKASKSGKGGEKADIQETYGRFGVKPEGQKQLGHMFHTILLFKRSGRGQHIVNTVKDRERSELTAEEWDDFAATYLEGVAGWRGSDGSSETVKATGTPSPKKKPLRRTS